MKMPLYILIPVLATGWVSCQNNGIETNDKNMIVAVASINATLPPDDFEKKLSESDNPQLLDVRTPEEFQGAHLRGALNYNISSETFVDEIEALDKSKP